MASLEYPIDTEEKSAKINFDSIEEAQAFFDWWIDFGKELWKLRKNKKASINFYGANPEKSQKIPSKSAKSH